MGSMATYVMSPSFSSRLLISQFTVYQNSITPSVIQPRWMWGCGWRNRLVGKSSGGIVICWMQYVVGCHIFQCKLPGNVDWYDVSGQLGTSSAFVAWNMHFVCTWCWHWQLNSALKLTRRFRRLREKRLLACVCVRPHGRFQLPLDGFSWNLIFEYCSKRCRENSSFIKIWHE